jgi:hypothetical protein
VEQEEATITRQHISVAANKHAAVEELLEVAFSPHSVFIYIYIERERTKTDTGSSSPVSLELHC